MVSVGGSVALLAAPTTTPVPPTTAITTVLISKPTSPSPVLTTIGNTIVQLPGSSTPSFWATWLAPLVTLAVGIYAAFLLRRTGKGTVAAARHSAKASQDAADASAESARVARDSVEVARMASQELDISHRREESMRMIRWASEQVTSGNDLKARMGVGALNALSEGALLQPEDRGLMVAVVQAIVEPALDEYDDGDEFEVDDDEE